ncbi:hypothetical protein BDR26DRAFT_952386 [Obelidium mucronatum]|nr:hypothetical protein BDR26DRAFT_952386 [Obelidium mucronatum]
MLLVVLGGAGRIRLDLCAHLVELLREVAGGGVPLVAVDERVAGVVAGVEAVGVRVEVRGERVRVDAAVVFVPVRVEVAAAAAAAAAEALAVRVAAVVVALPAAAGFLRAAAAAWLGAAAAAANRTGDTPRTARLVSTSVDESPASSSASLNRPASDKLLSVSFFIGCFDDQKQEKQERKKERKQSLQQLSTRLKLFT